MFEVKLTRLIDILGAVAVGSSDWESALTQVAFLQDGTHGQLISFGPGGDLRFSYISNLSPDAGAEIATFDESDPEVNPRIVGGAKAKELEVQTDADHQILTTTKGRAFRDCLWRNDVPYITMVPLIKSPEAMVGLAVLRNRRQGVADARSCDAMSIIAPHVRGAVRLKLALEDQALPLITRSLEAMNSAAVLVDSTGQVRGMSGKAEVIIRSGTHLRLICGRLAPAHDHQGTILESLIAYACSARNPAAPPIFIQARCKRSEMRQALKVEAFSLPRSDFSLGFEPRAILVLDGGEVQRNRPSSFLPEVISLTVRERECLTLLAHGDRVAAIADRLRIAPVTVELHLRNARLKLGARTMPEAIAKAARDLPF